MFLGVNSPPEQTKRSVYSIDWPSSTWIPPNLITTSIISHLRSCCLQSLGTKRVQVEDTAIDNNLTKRYSVKILRNGIIKDKEKELTRSIQSTCKQSTKLTFFPGYWWKMCVHTSFVNVTIKTQYIYFFMLEGNANTEEISAEPC